jgi:hypothetical protein
MSIVTSSFSFMATGGDVVVRLDGAFGNPVTSPFINGFTMLAVPEPASGLLFAGGALALACFGMRGRSRRWARRVGWLAVLASVLLGGAREAAAVDLRIDFGVADNDSFTSSTPNEIQAGFSGFNFQPEFNGSPTQDVVFVFPQITTTQNISGVNVSIHGGGNGLTIYDFATDVAGPLGDLVEDGTFTFDADITVTLNGLPAGVYVMTGYHHLADPPGGLPTPFPAFDIYVNTGSGESLAAADIVASTGFNPESITTSNFQFTATGADVVVRLDGEFVGSSIPAILNGFTLVEVPEPTSGALLALGAAILAGGYRSSRSRARPNWLKPGDSRSL